MEKDTEEKIIQLETKLAYLEDFLNQLQSVAVENSTTIEKLREENKLMAQKIRELSVFAFIVSFVIMTLTFVKCGSLLVAGSVLYVVGGGFFMLRNYKWSHSIFHLLALGGSILHFFSVYYLLA